MDGKKTPDELVRRHGVGHGTNPDLMAEIKEKRASMAVQQPTDESKAAAASNDKSTASPSGIFSGVKLRYVLFGEHSKKQSFVSLVLPMSGFFSHLYLLTDQLVIYLK